MTTLEATLRNNWQLLNNWGLPEDKPDFLKVLVPLETAYDGDIPTSSFPFIYSQSRNIADVNSYLLGDIRDAVSEAETFVQTNFPASNGIATFVEKVNLNTDFNSSSGQIVYTIIVSIRIMNGFAQ